MNLVHATEAEQQHQEQESINLTTQLINLKMEQSKEQTNAAILESLDMESIDNLEEFIEFYTLLKAKMKAAKHRRAKLHHQREENVKYVLPTLLLPSPPSPSFYFLLLPLIVLLDINKVIG